MLRSGQTAAGLTGALLVRLAEVETALRLSEFSPRGVKLDGLVGKLNQTLESAFGVSIVSLAASDSCVREAIGVRAPSEEENRAIRAWAGLRRKAGPVGPIREATGWLVPILQSRRVVGTLRVSQVFEHQTPPEDVLLAIGRGCGTAFQKAVVRAKAVERECKAAVESERRRIDHDLHDSVTQRLYGIGAELTLCAEEASGEWQSERLENLKRAFEECISMVRDAVQSQCFTQIQEQGLLPALEELAARFEKETGVTVLLRTSGEPHDLSPAQQEALYRVANEALANVRRHSRATHVAVLLTFGRSGAALTIKDNGAGPSEKSVSGGTGLASLNALVSGAGGRLEAGAGPGGFVVSAQILPNSPPPPQIRLPS